MSATELDTELKTDKDFKPREEVEEDLREFYENTFWESGERNFREIGRKLINYHFTEDYETFDGINETMWELGKSVGWLMREYEEKGLEGEEMSWLGLYQDVPGHTVKKFDPSETLEDQPYIDQLTQEELNMLYTTYLEGKSHELVREMDYEEKPE